MVNRTPTRGTDLRKTYRGSTQGERRGDLHHIVALGMQHAHRTASRNRSRRRACSIAARGHLHTASADTRHICGSQLYGNGLDLLAIQEVLGHSWIATPMRYIHVQQTRVEDAWVAGMERAAKRLEGLAR
ncbi:tyrosine-type recombinase/integrase [Streptomyces sp. NPDC059568]|uniref:tyrosine-type recombinase/integrase n=1 Tax=Streptomyces sp. NPDC059568 TaxID=3346868 RepID=UPI0036934361